MPTPVFQQISIDRGPEPEIRIRTQITDSTVLVQYKLTQDDIQRIVGFPLHTVALKTFGNEDLAWILEDVNDFLKDPFDYKIGDTILVPTNWQSIASANKQTQMSGRTRP